MPEQEQEQEKQEETEEAGGSGGRCRFDISLHHKCDKLKLMIEVFMSGRYSTLIKVTDIIQGVSSSRLAADSKGCPGFIQCPLVCVCSEQIGTRFWSESFGFRCQCLFKNIPYSFFDLASTL
jgi:hypothetical protein